MDSMIKKWKKLINNEKSNNNDENYDNNAEERSNSRSKSKLKDKIARNNPYEDSDNENKPETILKNSVNSYKQDICRKNKFKNSLANNDHNLSISSINNKSFTQSSNKKIEDKLNNSSQKVYKKNRDSISQSKDKSSINKKSEKEKSLSPLKNNIKTNKSNPNNIIEKPSDLENLNSDQILKLLYKIYNCLPKSNLDSFDIKNFSDNLNEVINIYIKKLNSIKEVKHANEQKEIILQTKCNTAERMIKEYEIKYLTAEKEKVIFFTSLYNNNTILVSDL